MEAVSRSNTNNQELKILSLMAFELKSEFDVKFLEYSENLKELRDQIGCEGAIVHKIEKLVSDFFNKIISWLQLLEAIVL